MKNKTLAATLLASLIAPTMAFAGQVTYNEVLKAASAPVFYDVSSPKPIAAGEVAAPPSQEEQEQRVDEEGYPLFVPDVMKPENASDRFNAYVPRSNLLPEQPRTHNTQTSNGSVDNELSIGYGVSRKKNELENVYSVTTEPAHSIHISDTVRFNAGQTLEHAIRAKGNVEFHKDTMDMNIATPIGSIKRNIDDAKWLQGEAQLGYMPTLNVNNGNTSLYPFVGVGHQYTQIGKGARKMQDSRSYMEYGAGITQNLSPYQEVFLEGSYQKDFDVRYQTEYDNFIPKQKVNGGRGEKYTVEMGITSKGNMDPETNAVGLSVYHSVHKNKHSRPIDIQSRFGTYPYESGKFQERETGVKLNYIFH